MDHLDQRPIAPANKAMVYQNCSPGDTIMFPQQFTFMVPLICDYSQVIVVLPSLNLPRKSAVTCVVAPEQRSGLNR